SIAVRVPRTLLDRLARFGEIESIAFDEPVTLVDFHAGPPVTSAVDWDLPMIGVDQVWAQYGLDGTGVVVGSLDTGFDPTHPALQAKWRGGTNSWKDFINFLPDPYDDHGHATHTPGTMVGRERPGPLRR